ncbi:MAG: LysM domain-containing protein, partial [Chloroflexota bacterium]|nr:LysM domain-containing protein [Chloroflexota bacterium]
NPAPTTAPTAAPPPPTEAPLIVPTLPPVGPTAPVAATAAPTTSAPVPPTASGGGPATVVLAEDKSLQAVAHAQGVSLGALLAYNDIRNVRDAKANATIKIPPADYKPGELRYTIRSGDNLTNIAGLFGTSIEAIAGRNGISNPSAIYAGQNIVIALP